MSALLKTAIVEQAAAKIGLFGPQGSGKTTTSALIALGLSKTYHGSAPVAFMDTENGSDYLVPIFKAEGVPLLNFKSAAFKDMRTGLQEAGEQGCCAYLVDSYTAPWRELNESLKKALKVTKLEFRHMDQLKSMWAGWTNQMLNSPLHVILSGRLGYVWDHIEDENGKKNELVKLGTKMKSESEAGYEPSLLIEMEGIQTEAGRLKKTRAKQGTIVHHAYVLKDRWRTLNGRTFSWKDLNDYKTGDYLKVFKEFKPHFDNLVIGGEQRAVQGDRTSVTLFDAGGDSQYAQRVKHVGIALEEVDATLRKLWPSESAKEKALRAMAVEVIFKTRSWKAVESKSLESLQQGLAALRLFEEQVINGSKAESLMDPVQASGLLAICLDKLQSDAAVAEESAVL